MSSEEVQRLLMRQTAEGVEGYLLREFVEAGSRRVDSSGQQTLGYRVMARRMWERKDWRVAQEPEEYKGTGPAGSRQVAEAEAWTFGLIEQHERGLLPWELLSSWPAGYDL